MLEFAGGQEAPGRKHSSCSRAHAPPGLSAFRPSPPPTPHPPTPTPTGDCKYRIGALKGCAQRGRVIKVGRDHLRHKMG